MTERLITLPEMLDAREHRAFRQQELLQQYHCTMICFTMNIAGPLKNNTLIFQGFELGKRLLKERMQAQNIAPVYEESFSRETGNEAFYMVTEDPIRIKSITASIEDDSRLGRLFDMDVIRANGEKVERTEAGFAPRLCLICRKPAKECARSRTHSPEELQSHTWDILSTELEQADADRIARLAVRALLYEVCTTPKPGLVDRFDSGSHKDMDIFTFIDSAGALTPYFERCFRIGRSTASCPAPETFRQLRPAGQKAEADMFAATRGINTHKGAVFSMGILCAALGRLPVTLWKQADTVLDECAALTAGIVARDFSGLTKDTAITTGQKLYLLHRITGVRGQAEAGFPAVRNHGLPALKEGIRRGLSLNDAGAAVLLHLIAAATDTNLIARSDVATQQKISAEINALLAKQPYPDITALEQMNRKFISANLSPGGSADLLAICYFLYFLEQEV